MKVKTILKIVIPLIISLSLIGCVSREDSEDEQQSVPLIISLSLIGCVSREDSEGDQQSVPLKKKIVQAQDAQDKGALITARKLYKEVFSDLSDLKDIESIKQNIESLNMKILFSRVMDKGSFIYEVQKGDTLGEIAKKFNTTVELIKQANNLKSNVIIVGDKLKITKAKFSIVVDKSANLLFLKKDDEVFKTYVVSTGIDGSTPVGVFKIVTRMENPVWFRKDIGAVVPAGSSENILGTRWLGINKPSYGIHGTNQSETLGTHETKGCVRMANEDVEELFIIVPRGTEVTIVE